MVMDSTAEKKNLVTAGRCSKSLQEFQTATFTKTQRRKRARTPCRRRHTVGRQAETHLCPPLKSVDPPPSPPPSPHGPHFLLLLHTCQSQIAWPSPPCSLYRSIPSALVGWVGGGSGGKGGRVSRPYEAGWVCLLCLSCASEAHKDLIACSATHLPVPPLCRGERGLRGGFT